MKPVKFLYCLFCLLSAGFLLGGCSLDDDYATGQYEGTVMIRFIWPDNSPGRPEGMSVLFYPVDGGPCWRFELDNDGGSVSIPVGRYYVLSYNSDTSDIIFENTDDYKTTLVTSLTAPDQLWCANTHTFKTQMPAQTLTLYIKSILPRYTVNVLNVKNSVYCYQSSFSISGLAAGKVLSTMDLLPDHMSVSAPLVFDGARMCSGSVKGFGRLSGNGRSMLTVNFLMRDGSEKSFAFDVTDRIDNAPDPFDVVIDIEDEIDLPVVETSAPNSGLDVGIDDWETVDIDLTT